MSNLTTTLSPLSAPEELLLALAEDIAAAEQELRAMQAERKRIAVELLDRMSEREVGALAGVSGVRVHQWKGATT